MMVRDQPGGSGARICGNVVETSHIVSSPELTPPIVKRRRCGILTQIRNLAIRQLRDGCAIEALFLVVPCVVESPFRRFIIE